MTTKPKKHALGCSITSLFLLIAVCSVMFAALALHEKPGFGDSILEDDQAVTAVVGLLIFLPICGLIFGYLRFDRRREIVGAGVLAALVGSGLFVIAELPAGRDEELAVIAAVGTAGLLVFALLFRVRHRKRDGSSSDDVE